MEITPKKVTIVLPAYNEEASFPLIKRYILYMTSVFNVV